MSAVLYLLKKPLGPLYPLITAGDIIIHPPARGLWTSLQGFFITDVYFPVASLHYRVNCIVSYAINAFYIFDLHPAWTGLSLQGLFSVRFDAYNGKVMLVSMSYESEI